MMFLLSPSRDSFLGHVIASVRSALMVGLALVLFPYFVDVEAASRVSDTANASRITGSVTHVRDGDTIEVSGVPVRLAAVDCPERDSIEGKRATLRMWVLAKESRMTCNLEGRKSYDREVGNCFMADGRDLGAVLVSEGLCSRWN
jgi:endonuclease YncB( thermonuclease family)